MAVAAMIRSGSRDVYLAFRPFSTRSRHFSRVTKDADQTTVTDGLGVFASVACSMATTTCFGLETRSLAAGF